MPLSPNMNLPIPVPSQTGGPQYALDEQSCFQQIDSHNHSPGQGSLIPLNAINVNQDLSMSGYSVTALKSLQLNNQVISPGSSSLYMLGNDLYFADGTGAFNVQITSGNAVAVSGAVGFSGLPSGTASAAYLSFTGTFRFQSATNTGATLDVGPIKTRNTLASSNAITINAPNPLPADYSIILPASAPASNKILQMGATGAIYNNLDVDNSTLQIAGNNIQVANGGITQTQLANNSVGSNQIIDDSVVTSKILDANVTPAKRTSPALVTSDFSVAGFATTDLVAVASTTITTTAANKNIFVSIMPLYGCVFSNSITNLQFGLMVRAPGILVQNGTLVAGTVVNSTGALSVCFGLSGIYAAGIAQTYTVYILAFNPATTGSLTMTNYRLRAVELN